MTLLNTIRHLFALDNPFRIFYHKVRAVLATLVFWFPSSRMIIIGVTGTDGKTTTCNMIFSILQEAGYKVGLISTLFCAINNDKWMNETKMTSLDPFIMNAYLSKMRKEGCRYVVLEVSSHALAYHRMWGVNFDVAVMTHIASDHLDLHKTMKNYVATKKQLFTSLNYLSRKPRIPKVIIINKDDSYFDEFDEISADKKLVYGIKGEAEITGKSIISTSSSTVFTIVMSNLKEKVQLALIGSFNVYNALAAVSVGLSQNIPFPVIRKALEKFTCLPGRMEIIDEEQPFTVIVDYAHTADALEKVLSTLKSVTKGKLHIVFGATGDRDATKRPLMGKIASRYADNVIVTDDDLYTEKSENIIRDVCRGIDRKENNGFWIIPDRALAIKTAIYLAEAGDIVLVAGKGAEQVQVTNEGKKPWDDRTMVRKYLKEREEKSRI